MSDDGPVEYTPRKHLEGTLSDIERREQATRSILNSERNAPNTVINYLRGYNDALQLVCAEVRQAKDAEIMGITPGDGDE